MRRNQNKRFSSLSGWISRVSFSNIKFHSHFMFYATLYPSSILCIFEHISLFEKRSRILFERKSIVAVSLWCSRRADSKKSWQRFFCAPVLCAVVFSVPRPPQLQRRIRKSSARQNAEQENRFRIVRRVTNYPAINQSATFIRSQWI